MLLYPLFLSIYGIFILEVFTYIFIISYILAFKSSKLVVKFRKFLKCSYIILKKYYVMS